MKNVQNKPVTTVNYGLNRSGRHQRSKCLNEVAKLLPGLNIGGSADLATSNNAYLHDYEDFSQPNNA